MRRVTILLAALLAPAVPAQFDQFTWTLEGNPTGSGFVTPSLLHVTGPDGGGCDQHSATWMETTLPYPALVSVVCEFTTLDAPCDLFDAPTFVIDGVSDAPGPTWPSFWCPGTYTFEFEVLPGQPFGFGIWSLDCILGAGLGDFHDLVVVPFEWKALGSSLDPQIGAVTAGDVVDPVGDLDGDGKADFIVGSTKGEPDVVTVHSGAGGTLFTKSGDDEIGTCVGGLGDFDGDGVPDVAAGTSKVPPVGKGTVHVWRGDGTDIVTLHGAAGSVFGSQLGGPGDLDGDGLADLAVRAKNNVHLFGGPDGHAIATIASPSSGLTFGASLDGAGDLDLDGVPDLLVSAPALSTGAGKVYVFSGLTQALLLELSGTKPAFGKGVAGAGDLDGDGQPDIVVSETGYLSGDVPVGAVRAYSAAGAILYEVTGLPADALGSAVSAGGDVDGDGAPDLLTIQGSVTGRLQVREGATGTLKAEWPLPGPPLHAVEILGNVDAMGAADIAVVTDGVHILKALDGNGAPQLEGSGVVAALGEITLVLSDGLANAPALLVVGSTGLQVPFLGGVLQPQPELLLPITLDAAGQAVLQGRWPPGLPLYTTAWLQAWIPDPAGPQGWTCTNGLVATQLGG